VLPPPFLLPVEIALSWGVVLLVAAIAACVAVGAWFAGGRASLGLAAIPALLAGLSLLAAAPVEQVAAPWNPSTVISVAGVPVVVSHARRGGPLHVARPTPMAVATVLVLGGAFLAATRLSGRAPRPISVDADGLTWWPLRRHGPRVAVTLAVLVLLGAWVLGATDRAVVDPAFAPASDIAAVELVVLVVLAAMGALALSPGGDPFRRVRVTNDAVVLELAGGAQERIALLDLAYASAESSGLLRRRGPVLYVAHRDVRRAVVVLAEGDTDADVERVRAAVTDARVRATSLPSELPEPPPELASLRQRPASRSRTISER
jgi:hypothetical protein